ncbi:MAG: exopolysaccharide biosynthesis polyprenyl glycosylphosphotransferase [Clostridia bacterium]|nr:exopolysaccharide biosynthesis polyprenyl glycosylphosphotransferase [Clostridia bacterium]
MATKTRPFHEARSDLAIGVMTVMLYGMLAAVFFACLSVSNVYLRHINRTVATTLLTFSVMIVAMHAVYGGFDVGRKKSKPVISAMVAGTVITDLVAYLQMEIMNVNDNYNDHLVLFGRDFLYLILAMVLQIGIIIFFVRVGNDLYFRFHPPRKVLLILGGWEQDAPLRSKIGRYRLQWSVEESTLYSAPDIRAKIEDAEVVFLGEIPETDKAVLLKICYDLQKDIMCKAQLQETILANSRPAIVDDAPFLEVEYYKMSFFQRLTKRLGDILISALALVLLSPLIGIIALAIRVEDHGPVFFKQTRLTIRGRPFTIWKFRTMNVADSMSGNQISTAINDPRITKVGKVLRRFRMDEIPQFINVFRGEMSLVGPRPEMISNIDRYKAQLPDFVYREKMKAGITGYAQIEGRYNTTPEDKLMLDLMYIESFSIWLDVKLLMRTVTVIFKNDSTQGFVAPPADRPAGIEEAPRRRRRSEAR